MCLRLTLTHPSCKSLDGVRQSANLLTLTADLPIKARFQAFDLLVLGVDGLLHAFHQPNELFLKHEVLACDIRALQCRSLVLICEFAEHFIFIKILVSLSFCLNLIIETHC